jgi:hypothetical protein
MHYICVDIFISVCQEILGPEVLLVLSNAGSLSILYFDKALLSLTKVPLIFIVDLVTVSSLLFSFCTCNLFLQIAEYPLDTPGILPDRMCHDMCVAPNGQAVAICSMSNRISFLPLIQSLPSILVFGLRIDLTVRCSSFPLSSTFCRPAIIYNWQIVVMQFISGG